MKNALIVLICFGFAFSSYSQDASREETMDWIEGKYGDYQRNYLKEPDFKDSYTDVVKLSFDRAENVLIYEISSFQEGSAVKNGLTRSIFRAPLSDLNPEEIELGYYPNSEDVTIKLVTTNQKKSIIRQFWKGEEGGKFDPVDSLTFCLSQQLLKDFENLPERTKKALEHLIRLCGGEGEKF